MLGATKIDYVANLKINTFKKHKKLKNKELDLDSFIKIYNGLNNPVEKTKSKAVKKKTVKKETKTTASKKKKTIKTKK